MVAVKYAKDDPKGRCNKGEYKLDDEGSKILIAKKPDISCIPHSKDKYDHQYREFKIHRLI